MATSSTSKKPATTAETNAEVPEVEAKAATKAKAPAAKAATTKAAAAKTATTKAAATSEVMLGMISKNTIRSVPSPENLAAVTKSRWRYAAGRQRSRVRITQARGCHRAHKTKVLSGNHR